MQRALLLLAATLVTVTLYSGVANASTIALGSLHGCGVLSDGTLACWGRTLEGQTNAPAGTFTAVSGGVWANTSCGLRTDRTLACWGIDLGTPPTGTFTAVSAAGRHACALRTAGTLTCWGANDYTQASPPGGEFKAVSAGWLHSCGIRADRTVACWGSPSFGKTSSPAGTFRQIGAGEWHSCGIRTDRTLACWGRNDDGESTPPGGTFTALSVGINHNCAVRTDGTAVCWGTNANDQLAVPPNETFTQVAAGRLGSCGMRPDESVVCWGSNVFGELSPPASTFALPESRDETAPEITPDVVGTIGDNGWYTSDVAVSWDVAESESSPTLTTDGCDATTIAADTSATTLQCAAESEGGDASGSVTVKRDATAPTIEIDAPDYECHDDGAGVEECEGETSDNGPGSRTLTVTATDRAGNEATQSATYSVPVPVTTPTGGAKPPTGATSSPPDPSTRLHAGRLSLFDAVASTRCVAEHGAITDCRARLIAGGRRIAVGRATGESARALAVQLQLTRYGKALLERRLGGVRATLQLRSGSLRATARRRAMLRVEHVTTPPGSWTAGATTLTARGERFVQRLRGKLVRVAALRCEGHAADRAPGLTSVQISEARAATLCDALGTSAPRTVVGHGDTQPIASNAIEAGRAANRRVELTIAHRRVRGR
ncbi:MAG TPA: hypothetical protein VFX51_02425 [Solirubrobacteraceae bacterium]|nr:hypothetical protein [Solirubrobacteraceae bacterium]